MKILVTGRNGQLGSELHAIAPKWSNFKFTFVDIEEMDLTSEKSIRSFFEKESFDIVINCAAYTAVDLAEQNAEVCFKINSDAARIIAEICSASATRMIHISTDYIFNGEGNRPLTEDTPANPLSVYGKSKHEGEQHVAKILANAYIIRTAWVYSSFGKNFVKTISKLARERESLNVIYDQIGAPTYARDLAQAILLIADNIRRNDKDFPGIYHFSNDGAISWFDFAHFIILHYQLPCALTPIRTEEYKTLAIRPRFTVLDKRKIKDVLSIKVRHWHTSLLECLREIDHTN